MPVEVSSGAVVVLGGSGVGVASEDLGVTERNARVEGVGDGGVPQRVRADVSWNAGDLGDPGDHPVGVAAVDRLTRHGAQHEGPVGTFSSACLEDSQDGNGEWHGGGLVALTDQVEDTVPTQGLAVVLDPYCCGFGRA